MAAQCGTVSHVGVEALRGVSISAVRLSAILAAADFTDWRARWA